MNVKLVCVSKPVIEGLDNITDLIAYCARVSNPSNQFNTQTSEKLIRYLYDNKHFSPFEMVNITLEIMTTRDITHQIIRHRSFSFQEFSQRYADPTKELSFVIRDARMQDPKNRQNSIPTTDFTLEDMWTIKQNKVLQRVLEAYEWAIENGIAKEQARVVLPEGNTISKIYMNGTLRSWIHYCQLRSSNGTQLEHMEVARECTKVISEVFPLITEFVEQQ
jgi:thymidylate synthase (FAD)